jgi:glycosyltransferase involved in cell wall biosynthesis
MDASLCSSPLLSILIPTLEERARQFLELSTKLRDQIASASLPDQVEIVHCLDDRQSSVGAKRNWLLEQARGRFVVFVDDDDDVNDRYVPLVCQVLSENPSVDCVGIRGTICFRGGTKRKFIHSLAYRSYCCRSNVYLRPPYHLNPMRREIACRYRFEDISYSEDIDWAMRICRDRALRTEAFVDEDLYLYRSRRYWPYQWMLDTTEFARHALGLQLANRVRLARWLGAIGQARTGGFTS